MTRAHRFVLVGALLAAVALGCGTSGSKPTAPPEVRFRVRPSGLTRFSVVMVTNGVKHEFPGTVFTASSDFDFYFENTAPPYGGTFTVEPDNLGNYGDLEVILSVTGETDQTVSADHTTHAATVETVVGTVKGGVQPTQEVRFETCVPLPPSTSCTAADDPVFGLPMNATLGDPFSSHVSFGTAPNIYFLDAARDSVHAVFALQPSNGYTLVAKLFINNQLQQTHSGSGDITFQQNL
jgi:hypothetical protein